MEAQFKGNFHLSRAEHTVISTTGTLTKDGKTYTFDPFGTEYVVPRLKLCKHSGSIQAPSAIYNFSVLHTKETAFTLDDFKAGGMFFGSAYNYTGEEYMLTDVSYDSSSNTFNFNDSEGNESEILATNLSISFDVVTQIY